MSLPTTMRLELGEPQRYFQLKQSYESIILSMNCHSQTEQKIWIWMQQFQLQFRIAFYTHSVCEGMCKQIDSFRHNQFCWIEIALQMPTFKSDF